MHIQTKAVHTGVNKDTAYNSIITPIYQTSTFRFEDIGRTKGYDYSRTANPTRKALEENIAALENGLAASATATGMSAITTALHFLHAGDHIICTCDCYGGTNRLLNTYSDIFNFEVSYEDMSDLNSVKKVMKKNTKAIWIETPSNPLLNVYDIRALSDIAHNNNALAIVDNTFLSPYNQQPFSLGADIIVHSTTKYLNGHSDVVGGVVVVNDQKLADKLFLLQNALGQCASPFDCWLILRGIKTLIPRMKIHEENAHTVARFLSNHPEVNKVNYPGLPDNPNHELAKKQQTGFGGMLSFEVKGGIDKVNTVLKNVKIFSLAESLGGVESLICHPATMTHASMNPIQREKAGINERIIRLSVGIEYADDLISDLEQALSR